MTKFQEDKQKVFEGISFDESRYSKIIELSHEKQKTFKTFRIVYAVMTCILLIGGAYLLSQMSGNVQAYNETSLEQAFKESYVDIEDYEIIHQKLNVFNKKDGAVFIHTTQYEFAVAYAVFEKKKWTFKNFQYLNIRDENYARVTIDENEYFVFSIFNQKEEPAKILIGNEEVKIEQMKKDFSYFIQPLASIGMPIYYFENHKRVRATQYKFVIKRDDLPLVTKDEDDIVDLFGATGMDGIYGSFYDFPLLIDPKAYDTEAPQIGDVVAFNVDGELKYSRIIAPYNFYYGKDQVNIAIEYGSILIDDMFFDNEPFNYSHINGSTSIFDQSEVRKYVVHKNEYFVKSDNWQSNEGFEGVIQESAIIGKVKGYSLSDITFTWPEEVVSTYKLFKETYNDEVLINASIQEIALMQLYAQYKDDLETWYKLHANSSLNRSYEEWHEMINYTPLTVEQKKKIEYEANLIMRSIVNEDVGIILYEDNYEYAVNPIIIEKEFIKENGIWKAKYEKITEF